MRGFLLPLLEASSVVVVFVLLLIFFEFPYSSRTKTPQSKQKKFDTPSTQHPGKDKKKEQDEGAKAFALRVMDQLEVRGTSGIEKRQNI